jgi:hypothetical protein
MRTDAGLEPAHVDEYFVLLCYTSLAVRLCPACIVDLTVKSSHLKAHAATFLTSSLYNLRCDRRIAIGCRLHHGRASISAAL